MDLREHTIPQLVQAAAERFGDCHAIEDGAVVLTFTELADAGLQAARAFCAAGIAPGDRVAIWAPNIYEWIVAAIGLQSAGGVLVPLNTRLKGGEAGYILKKSRARILCTVGEFLGNHYVDMLRGALGGPAGGRPVAELPDLERIVVFGGKPSSDPLLAESVDKQRAGPSRRPRKDGASSGRTEIFFERNNTTVRPEEPPALGGVS